MELGQMLFGNPVGDYETDDFIDAILFHVMREFKRVYWNVTQQDWDSTYDYSLIEEKLPFLTVRPYYWGDDADEAAKPNLSFGEVDVCYYKNFGRSMTVNVCWGADEWAGWLYAVLAYIRSADKF